MNSPAPRMGCLCSKATQFDDIKIPRVDPNRCGPDVRLGNKNRISGNGSALSNTNILQDRMYFEVKVINPDGKFCIGLSGPDTNLAEMMPGFNGNNKKERSQTKWTFIFESDAISEKFKSGDIVVGHFVVSAAIARARTLSLFYSLLTSLRGCCCFCAVRFRDGSERQLRPE